MVGHGISISCVFIKHCFVLLCTFTDAYAPFVCHSSCIACMVMHRSLQIEVSGSAYAVNLLAC